MIKSITGFLQGYQPPDQAFSFQRHHLIFIEVTVLIKLFYAALSFLSLNMVVFLGPDWLNVSSLQPLWPLFWVKWIGPRSAIGIVLTLSAAFSVLSLLFSHYRLIRLGTFVSFLLITALSNSFGKINHGYHAWVMVSFLFLFLPDRRWTSDHQSITIKQQFLLVFAAAQVAFMTFYSMSGGWKIYAGIEQIMLGQRYSTFHPFAMAQQIAHRLLQTNSESILGPFVIEYPWLGTVPYLAAVYLEATAIIAAFRPALHKYLGVALIIFHIGTWLTMTISFNTNILLLAILFVMSPFTPTKTSIRTILYNLPLIGDFIYFVTKSRERALAVNKPNAR